MPKWVTTVQWIAAAAVVGAIGVWGDAWSWSDFALVVLGWVLGRAAFDFANRSGPFAERERSE